MTLVDTTPYDTDGHRLLTVAQAAVFLCLSRAAVYNLMDSGQLSSIHIGRARRIPLAELHRFVNRSLSNDE